MNKNLTIRGKKGALPLFFILALVVIAGVVAINSGLLDIGSVVGTSSGDFVKPSWASLRCEPDTNGIKTISAKLESNNLFVCNANTEECNFKVKCSTTTFLFPKCLGDYQICDIYGKNCGNKQSYNIAQNSEVQLTNLANGKSYLFSQGGVNTINSKSIIIEQKYTPYKLFRFVGGKKDIVNSVDCSLTSCMDRGQDCQSQILSDDKIDKLSRLGGPGQSWVNYVDDWNYGPATNIVKYNGKEAYCSSGTVYSIVQLQMANGKILNLDPTYKGQTETGKSINGLGNIIANVECCPNEAICGTDFKYKKAGSTSLSDKQCISDIECFNAGGPVPTGNYEYIKYSCQSNKCIASSPIKVECTTNAQCNNGQICDLSTTNYGKCTTQNSGEFCGDKICQTSESSSICPNDCEFTCKQGQTLVTKYSNEGNFCIGGYGLCNKVESRYCADVNSFDAWAKYLFWIVIIILIIIMIKFFPVIRGILKGVPGVNRLIP